MRLNKKKYIFIKQNFQLSLYFYIFTIYSMVICKYYQRGNCRYGQYCQYEHINSFVSNKAEFNEDDIVLTVAKEVLLAERGEQWLLSCFGPLRERPCIPGMEDLSPEEVRWEMYEAQKTGMVEQAKLHFQQLCQDMKAKREALKNPTQETILMLKKILGSNQKSGPNANSNTPGKPSTFFAASQLGSTNNVFANKTFNVSNNNPFGGAGFTSSNNTSSIFGKSNNSSAPVFGGTATFGNNLGFGTTTNNANSIFCGNSSTSFSGVQNNTSAFGAPQNNSVFGGPSQNIFTQGNNIFGGTNQLGNASSALLFNNPMTSQANTSLFGGVTTTAANLFGTNSSSTSLQTNSVFGTSTTSSSSVNSGIFSQPKTQVSAFGGVPIFGGVANNYANNNAGNSIFGGNQAFGASTSGIFGGSTATVTPAFGVSTAVATTSAFDLNQQSNNNTFGTAAPASNVFGGQNINTAVNNSAPFSTAFGTPNATISSPFVTNSQQLDSSNTSSTTQFVDTGFGIAVANSTFGTTETASNPIFANAGTFVTSNTTVANTSPFTTFGNVNTSSPFGTTTLTTTTPANPFAPRIQQSNTPFGNVAQKHLDATGSSSPFGKSPFNATTTTDYIIDDSVYSAENSLTDDEKKAFLANEFILGQIPLKPPTKALR